MGHLYSYWRHHFDIYKYIDLQTLSILYSFLLIYFYLICCCKRRNIWASGFFFFLSLGLLYLDFFGLCVYIVSHPLLLWNTSRSLQTPQAIQAVYFIPEGNTQNIWDFPSLWPPVSFLGYSYNFFRSCLCANKKETCFLFLESYFPCLLFLLQSYVVCYVYQAILQ